MSSAGEVWVVEDDRTLLDALIGLLRDHGLNARGFSDPRSALEHARKAPPRVLVTDFAMPGLNGVELARALRESLASACPRICLLTGSRLRRVELTLFDTVMQKPFRFDALLPALEAYLTPYDARAPRQSRVFTRAPKEPIRRAGGSSK